MDIDIGVVNFRIEGVQTCSN